MNNRWIVAAAFAVIALGACRTSSSQQGTASTDTGAAQEERAASQTQEADPQDEAAEQATSTRPTQGVGGQSPHPLPGGSDEDETYTGTEAQQQGQRGRVPETRQGDDAQASASTTMDDDAQATASATVDDDAQASATMNEEGQATVSGNVDDDAQASATGTGSTAGTGSSASASGSMDAGAAATGTGSGAMASPGEVEGRVALVDESAREVAIDAPTGTTQVKVAKDAEITVNGDRASLGDLEQGQEVRATMNQSSDGAEATRLEVTSKKK